MNVKQVRKVSSRKEMKAFAEFGNKLYKPCPYYVPDLTSDIIDSFNPKKNTSLAFTDVQPFLCYDKSGKVVGRVAAIINTEANEKWNTKTVRFGLIDFIDDFEVSEALIDAVAQWGHERGMTLMQGPLGITDFDKEGMLIEDFDRLASMVEIYNYPYYKRHMERMGFEKAVDWVQIRIEIPDQLPPRYERVAKLAGEMFNVHVKKVNAHDILKGGYGVRMFHLFNECYAPLFGFASFPDEQSMQYIKQYLPLVNLDLVTLLENEKQELVGACVTMGSLSNALRKSGGKLLPTGWWHLLKALKFKPEDTVDMLLIGIRPDYQGMGINALFFHDLLPVFHRLGFKYALTGPQLENNMKELSQWKQFNPEVIKRRRCWTKKIQTEQ